MAFEQVKLRFPDGKEYGPVSMAQLVQWRAEGRVPDRSLIVDANTGDMRSVNLFPALNVPPPPLPGIRPVTFSKIPDLEKLTAPKKNASAIASHALMLLGALTVLFAGSVTVLFGGAAVVAGIFGLKEAKASGVGRWHALTGIIGGAIVVLLGIAIIVMLYHVEIFQNP